MTHRTGNIIITVDDKTIVEAYGTIYMVTGKNPATQQIEAWGISISRNETQKKDMSQK